VVVGKGKLFWFFSVGFACRQKPNVLDRAVDFSAMVGNNCINAIVDISLIATRLIFFFFETISRK